MSEQNEKFTLENLDHLIEEFAQGDPSLPEVRLLQDLQRAEKEREVIRATERVWQRLLTNERPGESVEREANFIPLNPPQPYEKSTQKRFFKIMHVGKFAIQSERSGQRFLVKTAAILLVAVIVGLFVVLTQFYYIHTEHPGAQRPILTQNTQKQVSPAFLYLTWERGVVKLDKQSGKILWTFRAPGVQQAPSVSDIASSTKIMIDRGDTVYLTNSSMSSNATKINSFTFLLHVYAINAQNGSLRWSYTSQGDKPSGTSLLMGNMLYLAVNTGIIRVQITANEGRMNNPLGSSLLALDIRNGHLLWRTPLKGVGGESLAVNNGLVYTSITSGGLNHVPIHGVEALDVQSGAAKWWTLIPGEDIAQSSFQVTDTLIYDITMEYGTHNVNQTDTVVNAFDALTGKIHWSSTPLIGVTNTGVTPVLANGAIYFCANFGSEGNPTGKIFALDAASGQQQQVHSFPLELYQLLPIGSRVYLSYASQGGPDYSIYETYGGAGLLALDSTNYRQLWLDSNINGNNAFPNNLLLDNGSLYFVADGQVEAANLATGKIIWQQDLSKYIKSF